MLSHAGAPDSANRGVGKPVAVARNAMLSSTAATAGTVSDDADVNLGATGLRLNVSET